MWGTRPKVCAAAWVEMWQADPGQCTYPADEVNGTHKQDQKTFSPETGKVAKRLSGFSLDSPKARCGLY